ncbi:MAG: protein kinase [Gemmataceae bacterium]
MPATTTHPSIELLVAFHRGQLRGSDADMIEDHLTSCDACAARLLTQPDDWFLKLARTTQSQDGGAEAHSFLNNASLFDTLLPIPDTEKTDPSPSPGSEEIPAEVRDHPRYHVLKVLGQGGMGTVYLAEHRKMGRRVALKVIRPGLLASQTALPRFLQEVKVTARLSHPHIVQAYDADEAGHLHFLVMEFVDGISLSQLLRERGGPLPLAEACEYVRQAALGLQHAHEQGMVHRDVKPHNLMITRDGQVKILDFGLAGFVRDANREESDSLTDSGVVLGTADYIAPELTRDARTGDIRADIYSLGCTLYQLLAGRVPFASGSVVEKMVKHVIDVAEPLDRLRPDLPSNLVQVVEKMMAKRPDDRYPTPLAVAEALASLVEPQGEARSVAGKREKPKRPWSRMLASGILVLAALVVGAGLVFRVETDHGEMVITTERDDVEVVISKQGKTVTILDTKTKKKLTLPTGEYGLTLQGTDGFTLSTDRVTIRRGKEALVTIERRQKGTAGTGAPKPVTGKIELIRTFDSPTGRDLGGPIISPDNRFVVANISPAGASMPRLLVWDLGNGKLVRDIPSPAATWFTGYASLAGGRVISVFDARPHAWDFTFRMWNITTGKESRIEASETNWPCQLEVDDRGNHLAYALAGKDDSTDAYQIRELATGKIKATIEPLRHKSLERAARFTPDGKHLLTVDRLPPRDDIPQHELRWTSVSSGRVERRLTLSRYFGGSQIALTPDGRALVVIRHDRATGYAAEFLEIETGKSNRTQGFGPREGLDSAYLSPDGRLGVLINLDKSMRVYDLVDGREVDAIEPRFVGAAKVSFSPDGSLLMLHNLAGMAVYRLPGACADVRALPRQVASATTADLPTQPGFMRAFPVRTGIKDFWPCLSPDGRLVGMIGEERTGIGADTVQLYEVATGKKYRQIGFPGRRLTGMDFTPDGKQILTGYAVSDGSFDYHLWDVESEKVQRVALGPFHSWHSQARFSADATRFAASTGSETLGYRVVYDIPSGKTLATVRPHTDAKHGFILSVLTPDGKRAVSLRTWKTADPKAGTRNDLVVTDLADQKDHVYPLGHHLFAVGLAIDASTGEATTIAYEEVKGSPHYWIQRWNLDTGKPTFAATISREGLGSAAMTPDGRRFVVTNRKIGAENRFTIRVLDREGKEVHRTTDPDGGPLHLSADGRLLAISTRSEVRTIRLPDLPPKPGHVRKITLPREQLPAYPELSADGARVAVAVNPGGGAGAGRMLVFDTRSGKRIATLESPGLSFTAYAFLPDGRLLTTHEHPSKSHHLFLVWDLATGKSEPLGKLTSHVSWPRRMGMSADGKYVWVQSFRSRELADRYDIYEVATGKRHGVKNPEANMSRWYWQMFSPDSRSLLLLDQIQSKGADSLSQVVIVSTATGEERRVEVKTGPCPLGLRDDGKTLMIQTGNRQKEVVALGIDLTTGKVVREQTLGVVPELGFLRGTPDGRFIVIVCTDRTVRFYDATSGREVYRSEPLFFPSTLNFSADSRYVTLGDEGYEFEVFRLPEPSTK